MRDISDASHRCWSKVIRLGELLFLLGPAFSPSPLPSFSSWPSALPLQFRWGPSQESTHSPLLSHQTPIQHHSALCSHQVTIWVPRLFFYLLFHPNRAVLHAGKVWILKFADSQAASIPCFPPLLNQTHRQLKESS